MKDAMPSGYAEVMDWGAITYEVPLAAEESMDPRRDVPKGTIWGMHTLLIASILTLFINSGLPGGASLFGGSAFPLLDGLEGIFGEGDVVALLGLLFTVCSFQPLWQEICRTDPELFD